MTDSSVGQALYDRQITFLQANDVDGLIDTNYADDAEIISFDFVVRGKEALRKHFRNYLAGLQGITLLSTDHFAATEDAVFFEATVNTGAYGKVRVYDAFVLRDGRIWRHFTGRKD